MKDAPVQVGNALNVAIMIMYLCSTSPVEYQGLTVMHHSCGVTM